MTFRTRMFCFEISAATRAGDLEEGLGRGASGGGAHDRPLLVAAGSHPRIDGEADETVGVDHERRREPLVAPERLRHVVVAEELTIGHAVLADEVLDLLGLAGVEDRYYAPSSEAQRPPKRDELDPTVRVGLDSVAGSPGLPLRLTSYVFGPPADGKRQVLLAAEADITPLHLAARAGRYTAVLDSYVVLYGLAAGTPEHQETRLDLQRPAEVYREVGPRYARGLPRRSILVLTDGDRAWP
jgi:hypothetical protein